MATDRSVASSPQDRLLLPEDARGGRPPADGAVILVCAALSLRLAVATLRTRWKELYAVIGVSILLATAAAGATIPHLVSKLDPSRRSRSGSRPPSEPRRLSSTNPRTLQCSTICAGTCPLSGVPSRPSTRPGWALVWQKDWRRSPLAQRWCHRRGRKPSRIDLAREHRPPARAVGSTIARLAPGLLEGPYPMW